MPIAGGGTWLCWDGESGAKEEGNGNWDEAENWGRVQVNIKYIAKGWRRICNGVGGRAAATGRDPSPEDGSAKYT